MKKRVKLLTTIASLCLAVALMAFGVYAATNVNVTVSGTVSFGAAANVKANIYVSKDFTGATNEDVAKGTAAVVLDGDEVNDPEDTKRTESIDCDATITVAPGNTGAITYTYVIYIENAAAEGDKFDILNVSMAAAYTNSTTVTYAFEKDTGATEASTWTGEAGQKYTATIARGETLKYSVTVTFPSNVDFNGSFGTGFDLTMTSSQA